MKPPRLTTADTSLAVDAFMAELSHPHKSAVAALREVILATDPAIAEGVKWNAPSFRTSGYFATTHLRAKTGIGLILHLGAKPRDLDALPLDDPQGLLTWLAKDRALVSLADVNDVRDKAMALQALLRQWLAHV